MSYKIKELRLDGSGFEHYDVIGSSKALKPLSRINMFVGPNNSGKSRFLREIAKISKIGFVPPHELVLYTDLVATITKEVQKSIDLANANDISNFGQSAKLLPRPDFILEGEDYLQALRGFLTQMKQSQQLHLQSQYQSGTIVNPQFLMAFHKLASDSLTEIDNRFGGGSASVNFKRVYIPTLRSLRYLHGNDLLLDSTKTNYFKEVENVEVFTGQQLHEELQKLLLGSLEERKSAARFQNFLSDAFFEGKPVTLTPKYKENHIYVKIGEEKERVIYDLGDGIQSIIILTFPIFRYRNERLLLFVEEPELFLHPGMQRIFVNSLLRSDFKNAQCFIATHSNHLLDLTLDVNEISVFVFHKELDLSEEDERNSKIKIENVSNENSTSLELLGIQNSSVFLSNCTIWVEGITDRRYLLHYLNLFTEFLKQSKNQKYKLFKQDLHYSFVEYSGANITHWSFLDDTRDPIVVERLCGRLFLIADRDMAKGAKADRAVKLKTELGSRYYVLKCREIENLISPTILRNVVQMYEGDTVQVPLVRYDAYKSKYLGKFIEKNLLKGQQQRLGKYSEKSGTITGKTDFCQKVIENTHSFEDLSLEAKELAEKLYTFIKDHNP